jgi:hypothetical protein
MANTRTITTFAGKAQLFDAGGAFAVSFYRPATNPYSGVAEYPAKCR